MTAAEYAEHQRTGNLPRRFEAAPQSPRPLFDISEPNKADATAEKALQSLCESELNRRGIVFLHLSFRAREKAGYPDLTFVLDSTPIATELKSATGKLTESQKRVLSAMAVNGWQVHVVRSFEAFCVILNAGPPAT